MYMLICLRIDSFVNAFLMHTCVRMYVCARMHARPPARLPACLHAGRQAGKQACTPVHLYIYIYIHTHIHIHICAYHRTALDPKVPYLQEGARVSASWPQAHVQGQPGEILERRGSTGCGRQS